jgi:hypothetical protein
VEQKEEMWPMSPKKEEMCTSQWEPHHPTPAQPCGNQKGTLKDCFKLWNALYDILNKSGATRSRRPSDSGPDHWPDHLRRRNVGWISFAFVMGGHVTLCFLCFVDTLVLNWACSSCYLHCKKLGTHHFITSKD